jgi:hypothetical protein
MLKVKAPSEHAPQPQMEHAKFGYPSPWTGDPSANRNTAFSDTTTVGDSTVSYEHGDMRSSPRPGDQFGFPNMSPNITTVDEIPRSYEGRGTGFHSANPITTGMMPLMRTRSPHGNPPYELPGTTSAVS